MKQKKGRKQSPPQRVEVWNLRQKELEEAEDHRPPDKTAGAISVSSGGAHSLVHSIVAGAAVHSLRSCHWAIRLLSVSEGIPVTYGGANSLVHSIAAGVAGHSPHEMKGSLLDGGAAFINASQYACCNRRACCIFTDIKGESTHRLPACGDGNGTQVVCCPPASSAQLLPCM